jgi:hypothetical protein
MSLFVYISFIGCSSSSFATSNSSQNCGAWVLGRYHKYTYTHTKSHVDFVPLKTRARRLICLCIYWANLSICSCDFKPTRASQVHNTTPAIMKTVAINASRNMISEVAQLARAAYKQAGKYETSHKCTNVHVHAVTQGLMNVWTSGYAKQRCVQLWGVFVHSFNSIT